ncbi:hypothetical protein QBC41DRAFT_303625 [Cercophora samala]|uniref:Uncharacterized protein n=1 Tax=Cercophora samala TaxID=330535 RepID=A0AA40D9J6_9PEZI|nr:hypothetical protein QBC41DRAFT_303625 [Cercophora samala]
MNFLDDSITPRPQVPLLSGTRQEMVRILRENGSYARIMTKFKTLCNELRPPAGPGVPKFDRTRLELCPPGRPDFAGPHALLFHSIPRDVLACLVLGTVAFNSHHKSGRHAVRGLDPDGPGIYALGLKVHERNGKFLTAPEYGTLCQDFEKYMDVAKKTREGQLVTSQESEFMRDIDTQLGDWEESGPRFIKSISGQSHATFVHASLRRRWEAMKQADPSGTVYSVQSPLYIGCSENIAKRLADYTCHKETNNRLLSGNKFLCLTISLLKHRHVVCDIGKLAVIRIWEAGQLKDAELLVTLVAQAYTAQDGFNIQEGGGNKDDLQHVVPAKIAEYREYVYGKVKHLGDNAAKSASELAMANKIAKENEELLQLMEEQDRLQVCIDNGNKEINELLEDIESCKRVMELKTELMMLEREALLRLVAVMEK